MLRLMLLNCDLGILLSAVCFREQLVIQNQHPLVICSCMPCPYEDSSNAGAREASKTWGVSFSSCLL